MEKRNSGAPYSVDEAKKERSRVLAHKRRATNRSVMDELTKVLPLPKDVVTHLDYSSKLRLALCFFRLKSLTGTVKSQEEEEEEELKLEGPSQSTDVVAATSKHPPLFNLGMLQDLMMEALDGFLLVLSSDGVVIYISESVHQHLGIFQSEHIGISIYDMINEEDQKEVRAAMLNAETKAISFRGAEVSFFCRMKCSRFKLSNNVNKNPGHKLVYVSGRMKLMGRDQYLVAVVRPVSPPSVVELRIEANMFVTQYDLQMNCTFFDGRLKHLLGYNKGDLEGRSPFGLQHHEDLGATAKCGEGIMSRGEGLSGYYRFMCRGGFYVWLQTRGMLMHDSRTGKATHIVCMNYIISKEDGDRDLRIRQAITDSAIPHQKGMNQSYDPFPLNEREDGAKVNPLKETSWGHKENVEMEDVLVKEHTHLIEKDNVVVKQEKLNSAETSPLVNSSDLTSPIYEGSPTDSGLHSNTPLNSASAFSSTHSIPSHLHMPPKPNGGVVEHCLPDSTTGSDVTEPFGKGSSGQLVSASIVCWDSPPNEVGGSDCTTPHSVFDDGISTPHVQANSSFPSNSSPPQSNTHSTSSSPYQNGNGSVTPYPTGGFDQANAGAAFTSHAQGLVECPPSEPFGSHTPKYTGVNLAERSGASQSSSSSSGQLYNLLSKQPLSQGQLGVVDGSGTVPGNLVGFSHGSTVGHTVPSNPAGFSNRGTMGHMVPGNLAGFSHGGTIGHTAPDNSAVYSNGDTMGHMVPGNPAGFCNGGSSGHTVPVNSTSFTNIPSNSADFSHIPNSASISNGRANPSLSVKSKPYADQSSTITRLPAWNGIETEVRVQSIPQAPNQFSAQFVAKQHRCGSNGSAGNIQQTWHSELNALPQLTDEDMRMLDCFN